MPIAGTLTIAGTGIASFFSGGATSGSSSYNDAGTWRPFTSMFYKVNGQWTTIQSGWYNDKGIWRKFFGSTGIGPTALAVTVSPSGASNTFTTTVAGSSSTNFVATATGGTPPYTYLWNRQPVPPPGLAFLGTTTNTLTLSGFWNANTAAHYVENWDVLVTDSLGNMASSSLFQDILILNAPDMSATITGGGSFIISQGLGTQTSTTPVSVNVTGGNAPYTYLWSFVSQTYTPPPTSPFWNSLAFFSSTSVPNPKIGISYTRQIRNQFFVANVIANVLVTDNSGNTTNAQANVIINIE